MHGVAAVAHQIMQAVHTLLWWLNAYMRITRYVQIIGYGPVPHIRLHTQNTGTVV